MKALHSKAVVRSLVVFTSVFIAFSTFILMNGSRSASSSRPAKKRDLTVQALGRGKPWLNFNDGKEVSSVYSESSGLERALTPSELRPLALNSADFNRDGWDDLVSAFAGPNGGVLTVHLANKEAFSPSTPESLKMAGEGRFPDPFLPKAVVTDIAFTPDFLGVADFNRDAYPDVAVATRGGDKVAFLLGDWQGGFRLSETVALPGKLTTMLVGEINRPDLQPEVLVGVSTAAGPRFLVYDGIDGAMKRTPEEISLPADATAVALGFLDDDFDFDIAVAAGREVLVVYGGPEAKNNPDTRLDRVKFDFDIKGLAVGEFVWGRKSFDDLAVLAPDGTVNLVARGELNRAPYTRKEWKRFFERRLAKLKGKPDTEDAADALAKKAKREWKVEEKITLGNVAFAPGNGLIAAKVSEAPTMDLLVPNGNRMQVVVGENPKILGDIPEPQSGDAMRMRPGQPRPAPVMLETAGGVAAVHAMRLSAIGRLGLVVLNDGEVTPAALTVKPNATFTVDRTDDNAGATACTGAANDCSLRGAVKSANTTAGPNVITVPAGTYTLTLTPGDDDDSDPVAVNSGDLDLGGVNSGIPSAVNTNTTITGAGAATTIIRAGATAPGIDRVFDVDLPFGGDSYVFSISGVTISNGRGRRSSFDTGGDNGAIRYVGLNASSVPAGSGTVSSCVISSNQGNGLGFISTASGAVGAFGSFSMTDTTFSGNSAPDVTANNPPPTTLNSGAGAFECAGGLTFSITHCIFDGNSSQDEGSGGAVVLAAGSATVTNSTFSNNTAFRGSGFTSVATPVTMTHCTVSTNTTNGTPRRGAGMGLFGSGASSPPNVTMFHCTVANNNADSGGAGTGGGIYVDNPGTANDIRLVIRNTLVGDNTAGTAPDIRGIVTASGGGVTTANSLVENLSGVTGGTLPGTGHVTGQAPMLQALGNYGGTGAPVNTPQTIALLCESPAVDGGNDTGITANDQRGTGFVRRFICNDPANFHADIGAFEFQGCRPTVPNAGPDQTLCVTMPATLAANTPLDGFGSWSVVSGPNTNSSQFSSTTSPTATFTQAGGHGTYTLRWTITPPACSPTPPCTAPSCLVKTDDMVITYVPLPTPANAGADQTLCQSSPAATLAGNTPVFGTGAWSVVTAPGGGSTSTSQFSNTSNPTGVFTPSPAIVGTYTLRWTISNPPCASSQDDMTILYNPPATTSNAGPDQTLCTTSPTATLAANTPSVGTPSWSVVTAPGGGSTSSAQFSSTSSPTATFTPSPAVAGTYVLRWTITPLSPCPASTDDINLVYNPPATPANAGSDQTLCTSSPAATLAANTPSVGTPSWSVVTAPGGGSTSSAQFSSTSSPTATFTPSPVVAGTYTLRWTITPLAPCVVSTDDVTITYNPAATTANAGPDQSVCITTGSATLAANTPSVGTPSWSVVSGPSMLTSQFSSLTSPTATFTPAGGAGVYTLRWTITPSAPCPASTDDVVITFNAAPTTSAAGADQTICSNGAATLGANTPSVGTGAWSVVSGPSTMLSQFSSTTSPTATFTPAGGGGAYTLRWTISSAGCPDSTDDVVITVSAAATTSNAGADQTLCITTAATLAANTPSSGTPAWTVVSGPSMLTSQFSGLTSPTATFTPAGGAGVYTLRWTITPSAPCTASTDDVVVTFNAPPTTASAGADQTICTGNAATLGANGPSSGTGAWSVVSGPSLAGSQFSSVSSATASFTPAGGVGTYTLRWTITNAPCPASSDDVAVEVLAGVTPSNAGADQTLCVTTGSALLAANVPGVGTGAWSVVSGPSMLPSQFSSTSANNATFTPAGGAGVYTLRWSISGPPSCPPSTDDVVITFNAVPTTANAGGDQTICTGTGTTLGANAPSSGTGAWSVFSGPSMAGSQFSSTSANNAVFTPAGGAGTYTLRWTISNAPCPASTDDVVITVNAQATASNAGGDQTLCVTTAATLGANAPGVGAPSWSVVSGPSTLATQFSSTSSPTATFTPAGGAGVYTLRWTITPLAPCPASSDDVVVTFNPAPTANAGADQTLCVTAGSGTLAANVPAVGTGTWSVQSGPSTASSQFSNVNAANAVFTPAGGGGSYVLRWTVASPPCADALDEMTLTVSSVCTELPVLWAADTQNHRIQKFDGTSWTVVVGNGVSGTAANRCNLPKAVVANAGGTRIYVADTGNNRITYSTDGGGSWAVFAATGIGLHQVRGPQGLALDGAGNLYVADALNERVLRFAGGLPGTAFALATSGTGAGQVKSPRGLAIDNLGNLYVTDKVMHRLLRIANAAGVAVANTGVAVVSGQGLGLSNLNGPEGCAVDNNGNVYVADTLNERVIQFPGGTSPGIVMTDGAGTTLGKVNRPEGVAVTLFAAGPLAGQTMLVVGDTGGNRIEGRPVAGGAWQLVGTPNGVGSGIGQFRNPSKIR